MSFSPKLGQIEVQNGRPVPAYYFSSNFDRESAIPQSKRDLMTSHLLVHVAGTSRSVRSFNYTDICIYMQKLYA